VTNKCLIDVFKQAGVYDQQRIDARQRRKTGIQGWLAREQYQRWVPTLDSSLIYRLSDSNSLALCQYKLHLHFTCLLVTHFNNFRPSQFLTPEMINVRIPSLESIWDGSVPTWSNTTLAEDATLVGVLFQSETEATRYKNIASIVAWDFSLGMALGCLLTRQPGESDVALFQRMSPCLLVHLNAMERYQSARR
jgi:hypothetical protein